MATKVWYSNFALYVKPNLEDVDSYLEQGDFAESEDIPKMFGLLDRSASDPAI